VIQTITGFNTFIISGSKDKNVKVYELRGDIFQEFLLENAIK